MCTIVLLTFNMLRIVTASEDIRTSLVAKLFCINDVTTHMPMLLYFNMSCIDCEKQRLCILPLGRWY